MAESVLASEERAMIRAVLLDPADDGPRLILADWYEEHGQEGLARWVRRSVAEGWPDTIGPHGEMALRVHKDRPPILIRSDGYGFGCSLTVHRGFVSEWHGPLSTFLASAERLFSEQPVERVVLTDRVPQEFSHPDGSSRHRWRSAWDTLSFYVPPEILQRLTGLRAVPFSDGGHVAPFYSTPDAALADLSTACVAYGRDLAGLPPMPERKESQ